MNKSYFTPWISEEDKFAYDVTKLIQTMHSQHNERRFSDARHQPHVQLTKTDT